MYAPGSNVNMTAFHTWPWLPEKPPSGPVERIKSLGTTYFLWLERIHWSSPFRSDRGNWEGVHVLLGSDRCSLSVNHSSALTTL